MHSFTYLASALLPAVTLAMTHTVTVGGLTADGSPNLVYTPESVDAMVGDTVHFVFKQLNHTASQSAFDTPCNLLEGGMDSGFMPNADGADGVTWDMKVTTTEPIWMYCRQEGHCGTGMVFAVNPAKTGDKTMADFKQLAIKLNGTASSYTPSGVVGGDGCYSASQTYAMSAPTATGYGTAPDGSSCQCSCACESNNLPYGAGVGSFGGWSAAL
jgi:plastocyanin